MSARSDIISGPVGQAIRAWAVGHATEKWGARMKEEAVQLLREEMGTATSVSVPEGTVTAVPPATEVVLDLDRLAEVIGPEAFAKVTRTTLDPKALERAIETGEVDADAVASCVTGETTVRRGYLKVTPEKTVLLDSARKAERNWDDLVTAAQAVCVALDRKPRKVRPSLLTPDINSIDPAVWEGMSPLERALCGLLAMTPWKW